jgi:hypothetical protein
MASSELVLLYNLGPDQEQGQKIRTILRILKIPAKTIQPEQLSQTLGALADIRGYAPSDSAYIGPAISESLIIFKDLNDTRISQLLAKFKEAAAGRGALKCVVTPHNQGWTLLALLQELRSEHVIMEAFGQLHQAVQYAEKLVPAAVSDLAGSPDLASQKLLQAIRESRQLMKAKQPPELDVIKASLGQLRLAVDAFQTAAQPTTNDQANDLASDLASDLA